MRATQLPPDAEGRRGPSSSPRGAPPPARSVARGPPVASSATRRSLCGRGGCRLVRPRAAVGGLRLPSLSSGPRPDRTGPPFPPLGDVPRGLPRFAPRADGAGGLDVGVPSWESEGPLTVRCTGPGPQLGTLTSARCGGFAPGRPPRAVGYPTRPSPPGSGGGFNVSLPTPGGSARRSVVSPKSTLLSPNFGETPSW